MSKKRWYEREEIVKINHDWVRLNCKNITNREKELLRIVNERKLVRRDHLEIIHEGYRNAGSMRTNILNRSIKKLFEKMCLDKVHEEPEFMKGNLPAVLALDRAGAIIIGEKFRKRIKHTPKLVNNKKYFIRELPNNYPHIHGVNSLECETILLSEELGFNIIMWNLEQDNAKNVMYNEEFRIIPDVLMLLRIGNKPFLSYIEYDTGMEDNRHKDKFPTIREKLERYRMFKLSSAWKDEKWSKLGFPLLLFVTEDMGRIAFVNDKARLLGLKTIVMHTSEYRDKLRVLIN